MRYRTRPGKADGVTLAAIALAASAFAEASADKAMGLLVALMTVAAFVCSSMPQTDIKPAFLTPSLPGTAFELMPRRLQMYTGPR